MRLPISPDLMVFLNAGIVFIVVWLAVRFLNSQGESHFRDDIWGGSEKRNASNAEQMFRTVDYIALEAPPEENTAKIHAGYPPPEMEKTDPGQPAFVPPRVEPQPFRTPNFRGKPHEILGIPALADRETVLAAYKHWIKRYHPDRVQHLGPGYVKQANLRAEQLNEAKNILLKLLD